MAEQNPKVLFLPTTVGYKKNASEGIKKSGASFGTKANRNRLSRAEWNLKKKQFRKLYDEGHPRKAIGVFLKLSDKQLNRIFLELITDSENPLQIRVPTYEVIRINPSFINALPKGYFDYQTEFVKVVKREGHMELSPFVIPAEWTESIGNNYKTSGAQE